MLVRVVPRDDEPIIVTILRFDKSGDLFWRDAYPGDRISMANSPNDADGEALSRLAEAGVDLSRPLPLEFTVAARDGVAAESIRQALAIHGYESQVEYDEGEPNEDGQIDPDDEEFGPSWTVSVKVEMVPSHGELLRVQADLDRIAAPHNGKSDGWGTMLEASE
jgi:hypothetical protein